MLARPLEVDKLAHRGLARIYGDQVIAEAFAELLALQEIDPVDDFDIAVPVEPQFVLVIGELKIRQVVTDDGLGTITLGSEAQPGRGRLRLRPRDPTSAVWVPLDKIAAFAPDRIYPEELSP